MPSFVKELIVDQLVQLEGNDRKLNKINYENSLF